MEIRSVTLFSEPDLASTTAGAFFNACGQAFPYPVQTRRAAFPPFPDWWQEEEEDASSLVNRWQAAGADYISLGPVQLRHEDVWLQHLPSMLGVGNALFASAEVTDTTGRIAPARAHSIAAVIQAASTIQENGFGNLYFTALANCPPGSPFFPVAYHRGGPPSFALAVEAADLALAAIQGARTLEAARGRLVNSIEQHAAVLVQAAEALEQRHGVAFAGVDFSLAPFPEAEKSLAGAMEALGIPWVGASGSLFSAAFITDALNRATFPRCGFSGLMLTVLEDSVLALRAGAGNVGISELLSYAAVCGVGLDTVPLPGDVPVAALAAILLDVAALAARLNKPLTARLMPLPGLEAGDRVAISFPYFADSRVLSVAGSGLQGLLRQGKPVHLAPYHTQ